MISPVFHPITGGAETHVRTLAEELAYLGHSIVVLTDRRSPHSPQREWLNGVEILRTSHYLEFINAPGHVPWEECLFGLLRDFQDLLQDRDIDIIHGHCQATVILGAMIKDILGCPLVATPHKTEPERDAFGEGRSRLVYTHLPYDMLIVGSQFFRDQLLRYGAKPDRIGLIYQGINLNRFTPDVSGERIRKEQNIHDDQRLILLVGRFKSRKGLLEFVHAMEQVTALKPELRGMIAGTCNSASLDYINQVRSEIKRLDLEQKVVIKETFLWEEMPEVFAAADLVVQPSYAEGLGLSVLEAMATAKPVIGCAVSGIQEILTHQENGLLIKPASSEALAQAILHLLSYPDEAARVAERGYAHVQKHFSAKKMAQETLEVYNSVIRPGHSK